MLKFLLAIFMTLCIVACDAQNDWKNYLVNHHYSFSLDSNFDQRTTDLLEQKLSGYKLILLGEGGSHFLQFYELLRFRWVKFLSEEFGMTHFIMEFGHSSDLLCNYYIQTGDSTYLPIARFTRNKTFWTELFSYNKRKTAGNQVSSFGIDFERTHSYLKALKLILPNKQPPTDIKSCIALLKSTNDTIRSCRDILIMNSSLQAAFRKHRESFQEYLSANFADFEQIIMNNGSCDDAEKNRNRHMAVNFLNFDSKFGDNIYYGQLGMAHTILSATNTASIINGNDKFKNKVCVINTYCYNCKTTEEPVSNWQLRKIEKDILEELLPFCVSNFTLFDFTDNDAAIKQFRSFGQFLIIAKNQN